MNNSRTSFLTKFHTRAHTLTRNRKYPCLRVRVLARISTSPSTSTREELGLVSCPEQYIPFAIDYWSKSTTSNFSLNLISTQTTPALNSNQLLGSQTLIKNLGSQPWRSYHIRQHLSHILPNNSATSSRVPQDIIVESRYSVTFGG